MPQKFAFSANYCVFNLGVHVMLAISTIQVKSGVFLNDKRVFPLDATFNFGIYATKARCLIRAQLALRYLARSASTFAHN